MERVGVGVIAKLGPWVLARRRGRLNVATVYARCWVVVAVTLAGVAAVALAGHGWVARGLGGTRAVVLALPLALGVSIALPVVMVALFRTWSGGQGREP